MERKLTAILSADVKGYSRLMGDDEEATIRTLTAYRTAMATLIQQHRGRVVDSPGDNLLAEFASAVDAVCSAVEIQRELRVKNAELPDARKMEFRIGINVGDVIVEGERIYGDGVNIAARIEGLTDPGGICVSGTVYDQVENKLTLNYEYVGEQEVKNIAKPVRTYRVVMDAAAAALAEQFVFRRAHHEREAFTVTMSDESQWRTMLGRRSWVALTGLLLLVGAGVTAQYFFRPAFSPQSSALVTQDTMLLPLPNKPSIVVLPFVNMSEDPQQEYFSDGITEDLTSDLAKISSLFVISRNSAFTYKGKAVKLPEVSRELGVRYVVEGSVRKAGDQVRITAQLIDATQDHHLWSERYDRSLKDLFALQDEIGQKIVTALKVKLLPEEQARLRSAPTTNLEAYDYYLRGLVIQVGGTKEANAQARQMFEKALNLDSQYAAAYARLSQTYALDWVYQWTHDRQTLEQAFVVAQKAVTLDDSLPVAHSILGFVYQQKNQHDQAVVEGQRAVALDPNTSESYLWLAQFLGPAGRAEEAIAMVKTAMRLNPHYSPWYLLALGVAYHQAWRNEEAIATFKKLLAYNPNGVYPHIGLACSYSDMSRYEEARAAAAEVLRLSPKFTAEVWRQNQFFRDAEEMARHVNNLRKAGLP